jgi:hypothetical protein
MENKMLMDIVDDITSVEVASMSKVFHNPTLPIVYSLSQELLDNLNEWAVLEKKISLSNALLKKINNQEQICKLNKEKEGFEEQKKNLSILIKKLEYINSSVKDFTLAFIFIRRFYMLSIQKENFEQNGKNITSKLLYKLKTEEDDLYSAYIDGDCFSKVLLALAFEPYQCYFKEYANNFFDNIKGSNDPYVNSLLILTAIFYECSSFNKDKFNLTDLKFFLSNNIPANVSLPAANYELVALRFFFFYELLLVYLKLKPVNTNLEYLKKSINLELNIVTYKASIKDHLLIGLYDLQEALKKMEKKLNDFLRLKSEEDKEADVNKALIFYKVIENEIQYINKKTKNLINNKYMNLIKMRCLLAIIVNEAHLPKFLALFNAKVGNDFFLNKIKYSVEIENNKEALNYLFHAICRDEFYIPLDKRTSLFINEVTEIYSKDDITVLDNITLEDLIEFSAYYIFTLLYTDFNASLKGFNSKLLYTEMVTFNVLINIKFAALKILEKKVNQEISKFFEKTFKNKDEYSLYKKNIHEEIKVYSEVIQDTKRILSDTKALESTLTPKLESNLVPMPEKNLLIDSLNYLEDKKKSCELVYKKVEKHIFIYKNKSEKLSKKNEKIPNKTFNNSKQTLPTIIEKSSMDDKEVDFSHSTQLIAAGNLSDTQMEKIAPILTSKCIANDNEKLDLNVDLISNQELLNVEKTLTEENILIEAPQKNLSNNSNSINITLLQDYEIWKLEFDKWKHEKNIQLYKLFHIIESCSKSVLNNSANAFLKYLSLHQYELVEKHSELKKRQNQIISFFKDSAKSKLFTSYLTQYQKWFDEIFQRIIVCRTLILQNEQNSVIQESSRLSSHFADNRAEFNNLLTFYLGATDRYNKLRDNLSDEENKLNDLNRNFIKQILMIGSLDGMEKEDKVLSDFSKQLDSVNQLKLAIEQEFETKQKIKEKLLLIASPEIVKFYLSRIDPYDADSLKNTENYLLPTQAAASCSAPLTPQENLVYSAPAAFYYLPQPVIYPVDVVQPHNQIFYSM